MMRSQKKSLCSEGKPIWANRKVFQKQNRMISSELCTFLYNINELLMGAFFSYLFQHVSTDNPVAMSGFFYMFVCVSAIILYNYDKYK